MADDIDEASSGMDHLAVEDRAFDQAGRGGKKGRGGGKSNSAGKRDVMISKALSRLLRHQADQAGITLDKEGFAPVDKVVSAILRGGSFKVFDLSRLIQVVFSLAVQLNK